MNEKIDIDVKTLRPFTRFIYTIGELPTSYLMSMTYEEQLIWLCNYLSETVIPTVNNNAEAVKEVQDIVMELQDYINNYFDNLDVQEEINNKLDDMVEQGTLQEIIATYINSTAIWSFDTVSDMKEATNLINGSFTKTTGYHTKNDGGEANYIVRTKTEEDTPDEMTIIALHDETLIAELIIPEYVTPEMFGAYGDGIHDDLLSFTTAISKSNNIKMFEKTYMISNSIYLDNNTCIDGNKGTIYNTGLHPAIRSTEKNGNIIKNLKITDTNESTQQTGLYLWGDDILISNVEINGVGGDGIALGTGKNITVENTRIIDSHLIPILAFQGNHVTFRNLYIKGAGHKYTCQFKSCVNSTMDNITIVEGSEISCLSTKQTYQENPDAITPENITIKNIKIIDHGKTWVPQDANLVACLFQGDKYYISDIQIINSYTGVMKTELSNSIIENINVDGYAKNGNNTYGIYFTYDEEFDGNNTVNNVLVRNGIYNGIRSEMKNSIFNNIKVIDCGTSSQLQIASADKNSFWNNIILESKNVDCRGLGFAFGESIADNSSYKNIKVLRADGHNAYGISGSSYPANLYIECNDPVRFNGGRGNITSPFKYNKGLMTIYGLNNTAGITPTTGDVVIYNTTAKTSIGYDRAYYNGSAWVNIIPLS